MHRSLRSAAIAAAVAGSAMVMAPSALAARPSQAPNHKISHSTSTNWSGYAVTGTTYRSVSANWTQPSVNCSVTPTGWSSFWIGLDGDNSNTVEQTGSEADCSSGKAVYSAWYEMYPKFPVNFSNPVFAGDQFTSSVTTDGRGNFTLTLSDTTRGWTQTNYAKLKSARLSSAEVIAEAPSSSGGVLPLADFGSVGFSAAKVNGATLTSSTAGLDPITMVSGSTVKAKPSSLSSGSFSISWLHS
jgi:peptidase A4-like protein